MTKPEQAGLRETLKQTIGIRFYSGDFQESIIDKVMALFEATALEIIGNSDIAISGMPGQTNDNMARNGLRTQQHQALSKLLGRGEEG